MKDNNQFLGHGSALVTIIIWGTTFIATKQLLQYFTPVEILFLRFILGFFALCIAYPKKMCGTTINQELLFAAAGLCGVTLYFLLENIALTYTLASNVGVLVSVAPFFTALLAYCFLDGEKPQIHFYIGFLSAITGIVFISMNGNLVLKLNPKGDILAVLAALLWSCYSVLTKKISNLGYHTIHTTRRIFGYGLLFMLPALFFFPFQWEWRRFMAIGNLLNLLFLGFGASALCFVTWNFAVKTLGAVKTSVYIYLVPLITIATSMVVLQEPVTPVAIGGTALILTGLFLSEKKTKHTRRFLLRLNKNKTL